MPGRLNGFLEKPLELLLRLFLPDVHQEPAVLELFLVLLDLPDIFHLLDSYDYLSFSSSSSTIH